MRKFEPCLCGDPQCSHCGTPTAWGCYDGLRGGELELPLADALDASRPGRNDDAVAYLHGLPMVREQLMGISDEDLRAACLESGGWDIDECEDRAENEQRIIWFAAHDIREQPGGDRT